MYRVGAVGPDPDMVRWTPVPGTLVPTGTVSDTCSTGNTWSEDGELGL